MIAKKCKSMIKDNGNRKQDLHKFNKIIEQKPSFFFFNHLRDFVDTWL